MATKEKDGRITRATERARKATKEAAEVKDYLLRTEADKKRRTFARKMLKEKGYLVGTEKQIYDKYEEIANFYHTGNLNNSKKHIWGMLAIRARGLKTKKYNLGLRPLD